VRLPALAARPVILFIPENLRLEEFSHGFIQIREVQGRGSRPVDPVPNNEQKRVSPLSTRAGRLLDQRNSLKAPHGAGNRGGFHAFRRFRFAVLRKAGVLENLIKLWMGHSQNLMDLYAAQLRLDMAHRREWCDRAGLGFGLGELGYKSLAPIRPLLVA
jgi:hypothetical protein